MSDKEDLEKLCKFLEKNDSLTHIFGDGEVNPEYPSAKKVSVKGVWSKELGISKEE